MNEPAPLPPQLEAIVSARVDQNHLWLLERVYYVAGGMTMVCSCFPLIHLTIFLILGLSPHLASSAGNGSHGKNGEAPAALFLIFAAFIGVAIVLGWTFGALQIYVGRCLRNRRHPLLVQIIAGLECIFIPWGTFIGVTTFMLMERPSVRAAFSR